MDQVKAPLTVIVVTYNSTAVLVDCLRGLPQAMTGVGDWQLVVVDNASSDGSLDLAREMAPSAICTNTGRNAGYAAAINHGIAVACDAGNVGDVLVMNPDVRLREGSGKLLLETLVRSNAGIVAPRLIDEGGALLFSQRRDPTLNRALGEAILGGHRAGRFRPLGEVVTDPRAYEQPGWVDWASGAALLISGACRRAVGPWDESFFLYSEETEYCIRARHAGFRVRFEPRATAVHIGGQLESSGNLRRHLVRNKVTLYQRTHGPIATATYRGTLALSDAIRAATGSKPHREGLSELVRRAPDVAPASRQPPASGLNRGFVFFSAQDFWYHNRAHSDFQLARNLAADRPVLFVNSIGMRIPKPGVSSQVTRRLLRKLRSISRAIRRPIPQLPNLYVMTPLILPFYGNAILRGLNARLVAWQTTAALRRMGIRRPDAVVTIPTAAGVIDHLSLRSLIVNRSDKYSAFGETNQKNIRLMEEDLLARAGAAVYVSHQLMADEKPLTRGEAVFLGHGVDYDHFASASRESVAAEISRVPEPRIGFFGGLDDYIIDFELLEQVAIELPDAQLVLIGDATCPMDRLTRYPNVHWLGARSYDELPRYGIGFDVAIMPWLQNDWIEHCNPIKTKEYLALGLPIVSTRYPEAGWFDDVIEIAADRDEFVALISKALAGGARSTAIQRRERVRNDSWVGRAAVLRELADRLGV